MSLLIVALALAAAMGLQSLLSALWPGAAWMLDPFMVVLVYFGLRGGETRGMLLGAAAGWVQDVHFGGPVTGIAGLSKLVVGYGVGLAGDRFMLVALGPRLTVIFTAALLDALLLERIAALFEIGLRELTFPALITRASLTAIFGALLVEAIERRRRRTA